MKKTYDDYNADKAIYEASLHSYNVLRDEYNKSLKDERLRRVDPFRSVESRSIIIPNIPCPPTRQVNFDGIDMQWDTTTNPFSGWSAEKYNKKGILSENGKVENVVGSFKQGYLRTSLDTSISPNTATEQFAVYHTYGLLG